MELGEDLSVRSLVVYTTTIDGEDRILVAVGASGFNGRWVGGPPHHRLQLWDVREGRLLHTAMCSRIDTLAVSAGFTAPREGHPVILSAEERELLARDGHTLDVLWREATPDWSGPLLVFSGRDLRPRVAVRGNDPVVVRDVETGRVLFGLEGTAPAAGMWHFCATDGSPRLFVRHNSNHVHIFDGEDGTRLLSLPDRTYGPNEAFLCFTSAETGEACVLQWTFEHDYSMQVVRGEDGVRLALLGRPPELVNGACHIVVTAEDGGSQDRVVLFTEGGRMRVHRLNDGEFLPPEFVAAGGDDRRWMFRPEVGDLRASYEVEGGHARVIAPGMPNGQQPEAVLSLVVWDPEGGQHHQLVGHVHDLQVILVFQDRGRNMLLSGDDAGVMIVWDLATHAPAPHIVRAANHLG
jgi:hypothetical protein